MTNPVHRRQLEDVQDRRTRRSCSSRSSAALVKDITDVEIVVAPPFTALHAVGRSGAQHATSASPRRISTGSARARSPAKCQRGDDQGGRRRVRDHRPLRAAAAVRRDRRDGQPEDRRRRSPPALTPIVCVGETLEERERNETLAVLDRQIKDGLDGLTGDQVARAGDRLRAGLGDRHRPQRDARAGRRGARAHPRRGCGSGSAPMPPSSAT